MTRLPPEQETKARETCPDHLKVLGYGNMKNKLMFQGSKFHYLNARWYLWPGNYQFYGINKKSLYACRPEDFDRLSPHFTRPWEEELSRTIPEWLDTLPDGYRERAIKNYDPEFADGAEIEDMEDALIYGFYWQKSPEGHLFWSLVLEHYPHKSPLPPLPEEERELSPFLPEGAKWDAENKFVQFPNGSTLSVWDGEPVWNELGLLHASEGGGFQRHKAGDPMPCDGNLKIDMYYQDGHLDSRVRAELVGWEKDSIWEYGFRPHIPPEDEKAPESENSQVDGCTCEDSERTLEVNPNKIPLKKNESIEVYGETQSPVPLFKEGKCYRYGDHVYKCVYYDVGLLLIHQYTYEVLDTNGQDLIDWTPCNPDGSPIAPEPALGDEFRASDTQLFTLIQHPKTGKYGAVDLTPPNTWEGWADTPAEAVEGLTYVGEVGE